MKPSARISMFFLLFSAFIANAWALDPVPVIKAQGSEGSVSITTDEDLSLTIELSSESLAGNNADWWVLADTPFGWYHKDLSAGWLPRPSVTYQGPLFDLQPYEILNVSGLPAGPYTFYFGVDMNMNGELDNGLIYYESVAVNIQSPSGYHIPDTGQTTCYDDNGDEITCPEPGEPFYGQDGQFDGNQPSLTDNGDGTVTDNVTGLMWQQTPADTGLSYAAAEAYCESLVLGGYDDWRMPTTKELFSISDYLLGWPYLNTTYFNIVGTWVSKDEQYWTEPYVGTTTQGGSNAAFGVNHGTGHIKAYPAKASGPMGNYVRAVRGNTTYGINDFVDNGDGTVTDHATGLMWQQADSGSGMDWEDALAYAESATTGGYDDWRLPNIKELQSIVDYTRSPSAGDAADSGPAIDTDYFEITELPSGTTSYSPDYGYFWSSTSAYFGVNASEYYYAWYVAFGTAVDNDGADTHGAGAARFDTKYEGGALGEGGERYYNYVRLVRDVSDLTGEATVYYKDADADGYSDATTIEDSVQLDGYYEADDLIATWGDCDDTDADVNPGTSEICDDGIDNDCNGSTDCSDNACINDTACAGNTAELVINEIVAKAADDGKDWIEFYASGTGAVNLGDYTVVDDSEDHDPAALPDVTLTAGEFYVVFAADEAPEDGSDYVPFKLGTDDCVSLFSGDTLVDQLDWEDGDALIGYSYGRWPDGAENSQTLSPTRGYENQVAERGPLVINEIMAKDSDGGFDWFELYNAGDTTVDLGNYRITDDGEDQDPVALPDVALLPDDFIVIYASGEETDEVPYWVDFKLGKSDSLTLMLDDEVVDSMEWDDGDAPEGFSYGLYPDGSEDSQTLELTPSAENTPLDFFLEDTVEDVYITISETDWNSLLSSPLDEEYHTASITYRNITLDDVAFRTKGSSSLQAVARMNSTRYSFKVDMNYYVDGQKLLGMKKINLNNNFKDPSYMRERIAYDMMRSLDVQAPRLSYVNLYINGSLHGLYTLVEQVDSEFLEEHFTNPDGDLYKPDGMGSDLLWYGTDFASYSGVELKTNEETTDNAAFIRMVNELNNGSYLESVINVDGVLRYLAVSTALSNLDSYQGILAHNYYIYEQDGVFSIIPWDLNESFGTFTMGCRDPNAMITLYIDEPTSGALADRPLIAKLLEREDYKTAYHGYIEDLIYGAMNASVISMNIEDTETLISDHVANDPTAFYSYAEFQAALGYGMVGTIFGLQGFVDERTRNIIDQLSGTVPSEGDGSGSCGGSMPGLRP